MGFSSKENNSEEKIRDLVNQPGWKDLEMKTKTMLEGMKIKVLTSSKENFLENKGRYEGVKLFYDLIVVDPKGIIDRSGHQELRR
jgi:hypothetical protein